MLAAGIPSPVPLEELEAHLRDEIARLMESGADSQTAFDAATQKIGGAGMIKQEFSKIQPPGRKKLVSIFLSLCPLVISLFVAVPLLFRLGNFEEMSSAQRLSAFAAVAFFLLLSWGGWFGYRAFSFATVKRARGRIIGFACILVILWWVAFFYMILPGCEFSLAQMLVAILWAFIAPAGFILGVAAGVERAATRPAAT